jgi:multiple sugar transport system substrate-binding protein
MSDMSRMGRLLGTASLAILMTASAATAQTIEFWSPFTGPDGTAIDELVREFNATAGAEAGVEIELLIIPWDQYYTNLSVALASRTGPALAVMHSHQVSGFVRQGALDAFSEEEITGAGLVEADYVPQLWSAGIVEGTRYAIPIDAFPRALYYNKTLFEQAGLDPDTPPATGADLLDAATRISELGDDIYGMTFQVTGAGVARNFYSLYWQYNDDLYNEDMTGVAEGFEDAARNAITDLTDFFDAGASPREQVQDQPSLFTQNRVGFVLLQVTDLPVFKAGEADFGLEFGVAPFPQFGDQPAAFALGHNFVIPRGTDAGNREAALTFINWIGDNSLAWTATGKMPAKLAVFDMPEFRDLTELAVIADAIDIVRFPPNVPMQPSIDRVVQETIEGHYAGQIDLDQTVQLLAEGINAELANR